MGDLSVQRTPVATFAAPGSTLDEVSAPYPAVTDDYPITEYAVRSRLNVHHSCVCEP